jgi:hypothetical protein
MSYNETEREQVSRLNSWEGSIKDKTKTKLEFGIFFLHLYLLQEITNYFVVHNGLLVCMYLIAAQ